MAIAQFVRDITTQDVAAVRAPNSITPQQVRAVIRALQHDTHAWSVQTICDFDGYLSVLIEPKTLGNDGPTFFIAGTDQQLELLNAHNDDLTPIATFGDIGDLSAELMGFIA